MATFYVLPPRECLERAVTEFVGRVLPGFHVPAGLCEEVLTAVAAGQPGADSGYVVHREDLPGSADVAADLADGFGAGPGDEVVEIGPAGGAAAARVRRWSMPAGVSEPAPAR